MKTAVVWDSIPFKRSSVDELGHELVRELGRRGHEAEPVQLAFNTSPGARLLEQMTAARLTHITNTDRVIALSFPSYHVAHDNKVLWLQSQRPEVYELWRGPLQPTPGTADEVGVRAAVIAADDRLFRTSAGVYAGSEATRVRLRRFSGILSELLLAPPIAPGDAHSPSKRSADEYVAALGTIGPIGRQSLLIEAMQRVRSPIRLVIAGPPESDRDGERLTELVTRLGLAGRVTVIGESLEAADRQELLAGATAAAIVSLHDHDATRAALETMSTGRPVIGCADTAAASLVDDGESGFVCDPAPEELARSIDQAAADPPRVAQLAAAGKTRLETLELSWDRVVETLTR
jgi:glycosyltransferase involved in cell wall biosynthesis